ncbi:MAG TPA: hypothetical protein VLC47_06660 [Burkholderiales bacterium]|nr:hypothetical protein [Burkholderiales bacterium]
MMTDLDDEIRTVESRIVRERNGLAALLDDCEEAARDAVASPQSLLAVAALGFVLGEALRPGRAAAEARKRRLVGLLAGVALGLIRARYGSPWLLAPRIWTQAPPGPARAAQRAAG